MPIKNNKMLLFYDGHDIVLVIIAQVDPCIYVCYHHQMNIEEFEGVVEGAFGS